MYYANINEKLSLILNLCFFSYRCDESLSTYMFKPLSWELADLPSKEKRENVSHLKSRGIVIKATLFGRLSPSNSEPQPE